MKESLVPSLFLVISFLLLSSCGIASQGDAAAIDLETQPIFTTTTTSLTTTSTKPAAFSVSDIVIDPREVQTSDFFSVSLTLTNTGGSQGTYEAILIIDEVNATDPANVITNTVNTLTKSVVIATGESKIVAFDSISLQEGLYTVAIDNLIDYVEVGC
jgi:hypothetical protein